MTAPKLNKQKITEILYEVLNEELQHCKKLSTGWCIFGIGVPSAIASSKRKSFLKLERRLQIQGPFTKYEQEASNDRT